MDTRPFYPLGGHSLLSSAAFILFLLTHKAFPLMHFVPGVVTLDGASPEGNRAAGGGSSDDEQTTGRNLNCARLSKHNV